MTSITFSSDIGKISRRDVDETSKMSEEYFGMPEDPSQMPATKENRDWIYKNIPSYLNLIRSGERIVGYAFLLPCNIDLMESFLEKRIDEATLFNNIKNLNLKNVPKAIYLCASIVSEEFRGKGLATLAFVKTINKITNGGKEKPVLFYWGYSGEGEKLAKRIAKATGLELRARG